MRNRNDSDDGNGNSENRIQITNQLNIFSYSHQHLINLLLTLSEEINIFIDTNKQLLNSYEVYKSNYKINSNENHENSSKICSLHPGNSECSIIQFCLENNVFLVAINSSLYSLFEKINKLRYEENLPHFLLLIKPDQFCSNSSRYVNKNAIIGGTFNAMHKGHKDYIKLAFDFADKVYILLTTDKYVKMNKSYEIYPYEFRKKRIENYIYNINGVIPHQIYELDSESSHIQFCKQNEITLALIVPEYYQLFEKINNIREDEGKIPLLLLVKQRTKTTEGFNITSTLINNLDHSNGMSTLMYSPDLVAHDTNKQFENKLPNTIP